MRLFLFLLLISTQIAIAEEETTEVIDVFEADGDFFQDQPRAWLGNRSPAVLNPAQVPAPSPEELYLKLDHNLELEDSSDD